MSNSKVFPFSDFVSYADLSTLRNVKASDPSGRQRYATWIYVGTAGTAVIRPRGGASNGSNDVTISFTSGKDLPIEFDALVSGTATAVTVFYDRHTSPR
jgi:hypothetical protein